MPASEWREIAGNPIAVEDAWRLLDQWRARRQEIGLLYCGRSGTATFAGLCRVHAARRGMLQLKGEAMGVALSLKEAQFTRGPLSVWPRWPAGPAVDVLALQAYLPTGEWLVLAEGYLPKELSPLALPM